MKTNFRQSRLRQSNLIPSRMTVNVLLCPVVNDRLVLVVGSGAGVAASRKKKTKNEN